MLLILFSIVIPEFCRTCNQFLYTGCPRVIRLDCGVENTLIAECQIAFRLHGGDALSGIKSVRFGSSPTNSVC